MSESTSARTRLAAKVLELLSHVRHLCLDRGDSPVVEVKVQVPFERTDKFEATPRQGRRDWAAFTLPHISEETPQVEWGVAIPNFHRIQTAAWGCMSLLGRLECDDDFEVARNLIHVFFASPFWAGGDSESWHSFEIDGEHYTRGVARFHVPNTPALELLADQLLASERSLRRGAPHGTPLAKPNGKPRGRPYDTDLIRLKDSGRLAWKEIRRQLVGKHGETVPESKALIARYRLLKKRTA